MKDPNKEMKNLYDVSDSLIMASYNEKREFSEIRSGSSLIVSL